ncbi:hypothetical protein [Deinococcus sonorensis]|uniref:Uncharacterized protein n=2 Tax=Deinococcus sonorensis TaxID=309891 RepID=A0AAU7U5Z1_9DEIO
MTDLRRSCNPLGELPEVERRADMCGVSAVPTEMRGHPDPAARLERVNGSRFPLVLERV